MKKILSLTLVGVMMFSALPVAYAADTQDYSLGTAVSYTADDEANESYTITVPALLAPGNEGTVTLEGTWASDRKVTVTADASVDLVNSINVADTKTLDVTFAGISKKGNNTTSQTFTEAVAVADIENAIFGTWSGQFNYNVEIADVQIISFTVMGQTYQAEEGMTFAEWIDSDYNPIAYGENKRFAVEDNAIMYLTGDQYNRLDTKIVNPPKPTDVIIADKTY